MNNINKKVAVDAKFNGVKWSYCANLDSDHPIKMDQTLVIGIDVKGALSPRLKILKPQRHQSTGQSNQPDASAAELHQLGQLSYQCGSRTLLP